ncbi:MAG TPA: 50S ribosomal protein L25, partial [Candidatus Corynebacterium intestinavium]|nr:50S ribosomal protein L25 [Candidatus Corynebacterium intestinavium]
MADLTRIEGVLRTEFGKGASRRLRRDGRIPLV